MPQSEVDMERSFGKGVGEIEAGDEGAGVCLVVLSFSIGCEGVYEDRQTAQMRPQSLS